MQQFSNDGKTVELELLSGHLLFIDPLYLQEIADKAHTSNIPSLDDKAALIRSIEETFFPYSGHTLLGYKKVDSKSGSYRLNPYDLKNFIHRNEKEVELSSTKQITTFATDSGSFLILDLDNMNNLLSFTNYDDIVDAALDGKMLDYCNKVNEQLGNKGWAFVMSPGIGKGLAFEGSGAFIIE